jgi:hypothetical protein
MSVLGPVPVVTNSVPAGVVMVSLGVQFLLVKVRQVTVLRVRGIVQAPYLCTLANESSLLVALTA